MCKAGALGEDAYDQPAQRRWEVRRLLSQFARESMAVCGIRGVFELFNLDFCRVVLLKGDERYIKKGL